MHCCPPRPDAYKSQNTHHVLIHGLFWYQLLCSTLLPRIHLHHYRHRTDTMAAINSTLDCVTSHPECPTQHGLCHGDIAAIVLGILLGLALLLHAFICVGAHCCLRYVFKA